MYVVPAIGNHSYIQYVENNAKQGHNRCHFDDSEISVPYRIPKRQKSAGWYPGAV